MLIAFIIMTLTYKLIGEKTSSLIFTIPTSERSRVGPEEEEEANFNMKFELRVYIAFKLF